MRESFTNKIKGEIARKGHSESGEGKMERRTNQDFIEVKRMQKQKNTAYILAQSFDQTKGQHEQQIKSLLADTLKDILIMSRQDVVDKLNQGLVKLEGPSAQENGFCWKFQFKSVPKTIEKLIQENQIIMSTARIYFQDNPEFKIITQKKQYQKKISPAETVQ